MSTGLSAALTITATGGSASSYGREVDLEIDAGGDLLTIDPAGDVLIVSGSIMTFTGAQATIWGAGSATPLDAPEILQSEGWSGFQTETGQAIETEG
jgi:hypothetical protein